MDWCKEVGDWIRDRIEKPIEKFVRDAYQACTEAREWVKREIRTPIETWRQQLEQQCREQECNWWCLCCNKWFCWLIAILVRIIEWIIRIIGEWLVELICRIIVTVIAVILTLIIQLLKWVVLAVVCLLAALCSFLFLLAGIALIGVLLSLVALTAPPLAPIAIAVLPIALSVAATAFVLAKLLCEASRCRLLGVVAWALKWSITLGTILTMVMVSPLSALVVVILGGSLAALMVLMERLACRVPKMFGVP